MGDYYWGQMNIGGRVTARQFHEMQKLEDSLQGVDPLDLPEEAAGGYGEKPMLYKGVLYFGDPQASYGQFEELEEYLIEQGIPFDRNSDGYFEYPPESRSSRPGVGAVRADSVEQGGIVSDTKQMLDYIKRGLSVEDIVALGDEADEGVRLTLMLEKYPLPPFEFVPWRAGDFALGEEVVAESGQRCSVIAKDEEFVTMLWLDGDFVGTQVKVRLDDQDWELDD